MKTRSSILLVILLIARCAFAEDHPPKSDASRPVAGGGTPVPFSSATIVSVTPRQQVVLKLADGAIRSFKLAVPAPCFDKNGALIEGGMISKDSKVLAHFMMENGEVLVDRLMVRP